MSKEGAGTSEFRMGGYDRFISSLFYVLHVSACSLMLIANMRCMLCHLFLFVMIHESSSHASDLHMFHMIYDLACIFTMDIIDIMISMINISLYVITMLLIYRIKMTWKLSIMLTAAPPWISSRRQQQRTSPTWGGIALGGGVLHQSP